MGDTRLTDLDPDERMPFEAKEQVIASGTFKDEPVCVGCGFACLGDGRLFCSDHCRRVFALSDEAPAA